jgi:hypothetical protein
MLAENTEDAAHRAGYGAASSHTCRKFVTARLAVLKKILLAAYCDGGLSFDAAEEMATRMRERHPQDWAAS